MSDGFSTFRDRVAEDTEVAATPGEKRGSADEERDALGSDEEREMRELKRSCKSRGLVSLPTLFASIVR